MRTLTILIKRNVKLFFKDKGMFFTSLITPIILLVLYSTFLKNVYNDSFHSALPENFTIPDKLINGFVGSQIISSILAVSCVTVSFCANLLMVQDKANGTIKDLTTTPLKRSSLAMSYYFATLISALIICITATGFCLAYVAGTGWYMSALDIFYLILDVIMLVMFGTALSSIINFFLNTQGQMSAVGTIVSSGYGFICGAYMPISQFSDGLQKIISFLPGTYGTSLIRNHAMQGTFKEMSALGFPDEIIEAIKDSVDCNLYFFDNKVQTETMYLILAATIAILITVYIMMNIIKNKKRK